MGIGVTGRALLIRLISVISHFGYFLQITAPSNPVIREYYRGTPKMGATENTTHLMAAFVIPDVKNTCIILDSRHNQAYQ